MLPTSGAFAFNLLPGMLRAGREPELVRTVLGSCVSVCLWDAGLRIGGINHYLLPLWNGEGLASPRYGNVAITALIERLLGLGCHRERLQAKIFGGAAVLDVGADLPHIGERNTMLAADLLAQEGIPIVAQDIGGRSTRTLVFNSGSGEVLLRRLGRPGR